MFPLFNWDLVPEEVGLAFSGGVDSVFSLDFLLAVNKKVTLIHFYHNDDLLSNIELHFAKRIAEKYKLPLIIGHRDVNEVRHKKSPEQFWRDMRYKFFHSLDMNIISAHHLDDAVETYLMSASHGIPKVIPYNNNNVIRPFLLVKKNEIINWVNNRNLEYLTDPSNGLDMSKNRNRVRKFIVPEILKINPGIHRVISRITINREIDFNQLKGVTNEC